MNDIRSFCYWCTFGAYTLFKCTFLDKNGDCQQRFHICITDARQWREIPAADIFDQYQKLLKVFGCSYIIYHVELRFGGKQWKDIFRQEKLLISGKFLNGEYISIVQREEYPELSVSAVRGQFPQMQ